MNIRIIKLIIIIAGAVGLAGCASVPSDAGFGNVQTSVGERSGHLVQWRGRTADDAAVDASVHDLLQKELIADAAVQIALLNNLYLQATYQELGVAQAEMVQAGLLRNPVFSVERRFSGQAAEIDLAWDFLDLFFIPLRKRAAGAAFESAKLRVANAVLNAAAETRVAFYTLQGAEQMLEMRRSVVEATQASADAAKRLRDAGNINILALRNEQKLAAQAKLDLAAAEAEVVQDRERLNVLMGVWGVNTEWKIASRLPGLPTIEAPAQGLESQAIAQRLDLAAARQEIEVAAQSLGLVRASRFIPEATIAGHYEHEINPEHSIGPSIALPLPIFDQGQATVARGGALLQQAQLRYAALAIEIRSQARAAYGRMIAARSRAEYYRREVLPIQQQILEQTQLQYNGMFVGVFQLLQAKQAQIDAGREYIESQRDYWIARSELERAVGGRLTHTAGVMPTTGPAESPARPQESQPQPQHKHGE
jgi:cobalt-zinc-cadmium efflux system outer membrane protein